MTDGGDLRPRHGGSHYNEDDAREPTRYERAYGMIRRCRYGEKYCTWSQRHEGAELGELLKPSGCVDADKVDRRCPLCGGGVEEELYDEDGAEVV